MKLPSLSSIWGDVDISRPGDGVVALPSDEEMGLENAPNSTPPCLAISSTVSTLSAFKPPSPNIRKVVGMRSARRMSFISNWKVSMGDGELRDVTKEETVKDAMNRINFNIFNLFCDLSLEKNTIN